MEVLGNSFTVTLAPLITYDIVMTDQDTLQKYTSTATSDGTGTLTITLPEVYTKYDGWFALEISAGAGVVYMDSVTATRPYFNPSSLVSDKVLAEDAITYERIARTLINSIVGFPFEFKRREVHAVGNGTDYLTLNDRVVTIHSVTENGTLIWSAGDTENPFSPFQTLYGITQNVGEENKLEYKVVWYNRYNHPAFGLGSDYVIDADVGWPVIPQDIQDAAFMLADDIACGSNRYSKRYIDTFKTSNYAIDHFKESITGTGNLLVDNILSKYIVESIRAKAL
jgi:hypothetical protein